MIIFANRSKLRFKIVFPLIFSCFSHFFVDLSVCSQVFIWLIFFLFFKLLLVASEIGIVLELNSGTLIVGCSALGAICI